MSKFIPECTASSLEHRFRPWKKLAKEWIAAGTGGGEAATPKKRGAGGKAKGTPKSQAAVEDDDETLSGLGELDEESPAKKKGALNRVKNARVAKKCSPKKKEIDITTKIKSEMVDDDDDGEYYHDGRAAQAEADEADGFDQSYEFQ